MKYYKEENNDLNENDDYHIEDNEFAQNKYENCNENEEIEEFENEDYNYKNDNIS